MKVLVTGAGGYIGRHVVDALLKDNCEVVAASLTSNGINSLATCLDIDIFSRELDLYTLAGCPDVCIHLAWQDGFIHNSPSHMTKLSDHFMLCKSLVDRGLKHLVVMGTMHEVGYHVGAINENTVCNPISLYGIAKDALRRSLMLLFADKQIVFQWLRGFYIYGDDAGNNSIFSKLLASADSGDINFPLNSGKNQYDFMSVYELVEQIASVALQKEVQGIINCCSGIPVSLSDKVEQFIQEQQLAIKLEYGAFPDRPYDSPIIYGDSTKIEAILAARQKYLA